MQDLLDKWQKRVNQQSKKLYRLITTSKDEKWIQLSLSCKPWLVHLVDVYQIRSLNKKFLQKDTKTDVLSFPAHTWLQKQFDFLGEIFICFPVLKTQAAQYKNSIEQEMNILLVHGVLHLLGFDHVKKADKKRMQEWEQVILKKLMKKEFQGLIHRQ